MFLVLSSRNVNLLKLCNNQLLLYFRIVLDQQELKTVITSDFSMPHVQLEI